MYYKLAGSEEELKDYKGVVELLDSYFVPKVNVTFERHVFKQMEQQSHETVDKCVCRLRQKVSTCEISNVDETIRDQLIREISRWQAETMLSGENKCSFKSHARYFARAHEAVDAQMETMSKSQVSRIEIKLAQLNSKRFQR